MTAATLGLEAHCRPDRLAFDRCIGFRDLDCGAGCGRCRPLPSRRAVSFVNAATRESAASWRRVARRFAQRGEVVSHQNCSPRRHSRMQRSSTASMALPSGNHACSSRSRTDEIPSVWLAGERSSICRWRTGSPVAEHDFVERDPNRLQACHACAAPDCCTRTAPVPQGGQRDRALSRRRRCVAAVRRVQRPREISAAVFRRESARCPAPTGWTAPGRRR